MAAGRERVALILRVAVATLAIASGCPAPSFEECAVRCGEAARCPSGLSCGPDGFCHESMPDDDSQLCSSSNDGGGVALDASGQGRDDAAPADGGPEEICDDLVDNSGNELVDCEDPACADDPACLGCDGNFDCGPQEVCIDRECVPEPDAG